MEGGQETNSNGMVEGDVGFIGKLEVVRSEDGPEAETHNWKTITLGGDEYF